VSRKVGRDVTFPRFDERPKSWAIDERQHPQAADRRPAQEAKKDRFGAVVGVVGGRNKAGPDRKPRAFQSVCSCLARSSLKISAWIERQNRSCKWYTKVLGEGGCQGELVARFRPQAVVDPVRDHRK
jgi:hypothetical protein